MCAVWWQCGLCISDMYHRSVDIGYEQPTTISHTTHVVRPTLYCTRLLHVVWIVHCPPSVVDILCCSSAPPLYQITNSTAGQCGASRRHILFFHCLPFGCSMYALYIHCPLTPLLVLFLPPIYLHHVSLYYPSVTRYSTAALLVYHHLLVLLLHHSPITNWLLAGASYVIAMRLLACMQLPPSNNPLYASNTRQPVPFLSYFIFLFTATSIPPPLRPSRQPVPPGIELVWTAGRLLVKAVLLHVAVHALLWLTGGKPSSSLLSYHDVPSTAFTLLLCSLMSLLMYCTLSTVSIASTTAFSALCGAPLPPLFHTPYLASSPRSFWSLRWNTMFTRLYTTLLFRPLTTLLPSYTPPLLTPLLSALAVFLLSGLLHIHQSMAAFHLVYPSTLLFFILQFILCTVQVVVGYKDTDRNNKQLIESGWAGIIERGMLGNVENVLTLLCLNACTRWFWPPYLDGGFIQQLQSLLLI